jgi:hypothetical protein
MDIMEIINKEDKELLFNKRILSLKRIDWGKIVGQINQYIQKNILEYMLKDYGYSVYTSDNNDLPGIIDVKNNSPGFDIIIVSPENKIFKIQSKLRQVNGLTDYSQQIHFETTRRNSKKNEYRNHTGHICYSLDEFDFVFVSLINDKHNRINKIKNCNLWSYTLIPIKCLKDEKKNCCVSKISPDILEKNIIKLNHDIRSIFS